MGLSKELDAEFCGLLTGWDALEQTLEDGIGIVDFNLPVWQSKREYASREDVLKDLEAVLSDSGARADRHFFQRVYGLRAYMHDVMNGGTTPIDEYLPATMGFKLVPFPKEEVDALRERTAESLAKIGVDFNDALNGLAGVSGKILADDIPAWFSGRFKEEIKKVNGLFPVPPSLPEPEVSLDEKGLVRASITGTGKQFKVAFNKDIVKDESEENLGGTLKHEILGHAVQAALWADQIAAGTSPVNRGLTCMQGFEMFQMEALAEHAQIYYSEMSDIRAAVGNYNFYSRSVTNNFNHMILSGEESDAAAKKYFLDHTPWRDEEFAGKRVAHLTANALRRCYSPVYGPGHRFMIHAMDTMPEGNRTDFMRAVYEGYMDATDMSELSLRMGAQKLAHFEPARPRDVQALATGPA